MEKEIIKKLIEEELYREDEFNLDNPVNEIYRLHIQNQIDLLEEIQKIAEKRDMNGVGYFNLLYEKIKALNYKIKEFKMLKEISWSYTMPKVYSFASAAQEDWNQTLVTILNQIWATNRPFDSKVKMSIPKKFEGLFKTLIYFDQLSNRYEIEFIESEFDYINVGGTILHIENYK